MLNIYDRLYKNNPKIINLSLDRILGLLNKLGNPHLKLPKTIHVAGTNGKGSTVAFMRAMLEASGATVHVYTSPHLVKFNERIRIAGKLIDDGYLEELLNEAERANNNSPITVFELTTVIAFMAFSRNKADYLLLETGLGGKWDATNVITNPILSVITPIDFDHMQFLGDTISKIASEKAGIIKQNAPCFSAYQLADAYTEILNECLRKNVNLYIENQNWHIPGSYLKQNGFLDIDMNGSSLRGDFQYQNIALASASLRYIGIDDIYIKEGIKKAIHYARLQEVEQNLINHNVWIDGTHNPHGARALAKYLESVNNENIYAIIGLLKNRDLKDFLSYISNYFTHIIGVPVTEHECWEPEIIAGEAKNLGVKSGYANSLDDAIKMLPNNGSKVLITGSLYLAGTALKYFNFSVL